MCQTCKKKQKKQARKHTRSQSSDAAVVFALHLDSHHTLTLTEMSCWPPILCHHVNINAFSLPLRSLFFFRIKTFFKKLINYYLNAPKGEHQTGELRNTVCVLFCRCVPFTVFRERIASLLSLHCSIFLSFLSRLP